MLSSKAISLLALLCPSVLGVAVPNVLLDKRTECNHGSRVINGNVYYLSCGVDRPGGDYGNARTNSWNGCLEACAADSQCVSATYHPENGYCYFKGTMTYESLIAGENTITLGTGCQSRNRMVNGRQCSVVCGQDHHGGDYAARQAGSFEGCVQACAADSTCATAQYRESTGWCYLKDHVTSDVTSDDDVSSILCDA